MGVVDYCEESGKPCVIVFLPPLLGYCLRGR